MIQQWTGLSPRAFSDRHLQRRPLSLPSSIAGPGALVDDQVLEAVLAAADADILLVAGGHLLPLPPPVDRVDLRAYLRCGVGICARGTERAHPALEAIADSFQRDLGDAQIQVFITAARTHGFGWHFDEEDVFIAQCTGIKDYYFRSNTVASGLRASSAAFARYPAETSVLYRAQLAAGDFLYVPARWWHVALCHEEARSLSVGVIPSDC